MEEETTNFEEDFEALPQAVQEFLYNPSFEEKVNLVAKEFGFDETKATKFSNLINSYLTESIDEGQFQESLNVFELPAEKKNLLAAKITELFILPLLKTVELSEIEDENESELGIEEKKPNQLLQTLQERLSAPQPIAPTKREQTPPSQPQAGIKKIDPYHEPIE